MKQIVLIFLFFAPATLSAAVLSGQVARCKNRGNADRRKCLFGNAHAGGTATDLNGNVCDFQTSAREATRSSRQLFVGL